MIHHYSSNSIIIFFTQTFFSRVTLLEGLRSLVLQKFFLGSMYFYIGGVGFLKPFSVFIFSIHFCFVHASTKVIIHMSRGEQFYMEQNLRFGLILCWLAVLKTAQPIISYFRAFFSLSLWAK